MKIRHVTTRRIRDSRGRPTLEVEVTNEDGTTALGMAPAGASRGTREAVELRDGGGRLGGLDVQQALEQVAIALDVAASEFGPGGRYHLALEGRELDSDGLCEHLLRWAERYPIVSIEDPQAEDDEAIVHLATGWNAGQLKVESFARSERMAKWNEGIRLEARPQPPAGHWGPASLAGRRPAA